MGQVILEGRVWPCSNISLSVGGFEEGISGNMGIGAFLVKGEDIKTLQKISKESSIADVSPGRPDKRRRLDPSTGIQKFFVKVETVDEHDDEFGSQSVGDWVLDEREHADRMHSHKAASISLPHENENEATKSETNSINSTGLTGLHQGKISEYTCSRCSVHMESSGALQSHQDWHLAKDLHDEDRARPLPLSKPPPTAISKRTLQSANKKKTGLGKTEKGQSKLAF
jgi:DNA polymerase eta